MLKTVFFITSIIVIGLLGIMLFALPTSESKPVQISDASLTGNSFAIENTRIFDGVKMHENYALIIKDGVITDMGEDVTIPKNMKTYNGADKTVLPGLIDAHTHTYAAALKDSLRFGVTTNFDMFTDVQILKTQKEKRLGVSETQDADLWSAGMLATVQGGHGSQFPVAIETLTKPQDAQAWVAKRVAEGSDYIKIVYMPNNPYFKSLDLDTASALIKAAHDHNVMALAHISSLSAAQDMLDANIDGLVHVFADEPVTEKFATQAAKDKVFIIPTLAVLAAVDGQKFGAAIVENTLAAPYLTPEQKQGLASDFGAGFPGFDFNLGLENTRKLHKAGVIILAGSDAPNPGTTHGASLHQEMALLVRAGLTQMEALRAATSASVKAFGITDRGTIKIGARADLVILSTNPAEHIANTFDIDMVIKNGYVIKRQAQKETSVSKTSLLEGAILGSFNTGITPPSALKQQGFIWSATDDQVANGNSKSTLSFTAPGADNTGGALHVHADVQADFFFPWAGASFSMPDGTAHSIEIYKTVNFQIRGTPGAYKAMFFSTYSNGAPPTQGFTVDEDWKTITLDIDTFSGFEPKSFLAFAITTGTKTGIFDYDIDNVTFAK
ncbi:MAG: hypothetical protein COA69_10990 [Robiginitomaculum sp.]|nr:MAG: hypothetical protein COA69_10990 [Robiginitomaculum sp.]